MRLQIALKSTRLRTYAFALLLVLAGAYYYYLRKSRAASRRSLSDKSKKTASIAATPGAIECDCSHANKSTSSASDGLIGAPRSSTEAAQLSDEPATAGTDANNADASNPSAPGISDIIVDAPNPTPTAADKEAEAVETTIDDADEADDDANAADAMAREFIEDAVVSAGNGDTENWQEIAPSAAETKAPEEVVSDEVVLQNLGMNDIKNIINAEHAHQSSKLAAIFNLACKFYDTLKRKGLNKTNDIKLWGLYKQATLGDVEEALGLYTHLPKNKRDAWANNSDLSQNEAKVRYVRLILALLAKHKIVIELGDKMPSMTSVPQQYQQEPGASSSDAAVRAEAGQLANGVHDEKSNGPMEELVDLEHADETGRDEFDLGDSDTEFVSTVLGSGAIDYQENRRYEMAQEELKTLRKGVNYQNKRLAMNKSKNDMSDNPYVQLFEKYKKLAKVKQKKEMQAMKKFITKHKIDVNGEYPAASDSDDNTSFIGCVAQSGNYKLLEFLIKECNGNKDAQDTDGYSLLHIAASNGCKGMVKALFKLGARKDILSYGPDGETPAEMADESVSYLFEPKE